jgi:hypothetical protein
MLTVQFLLLQLLIHPLKIRNLIVVVVVVVVVDAAAVETNNCLQVQKTS